MPHRVIPILRNNLRQPLKGSLQVLLSEIEDIAHVPVVGNPVYDSPAILALVDYAHFRDTQGISVEEIGIVRCPELPKNYHSRTMSTCRWLHRPRIAFRTTFFEW